MTNRYGVPYMGSKNDIAEQIIQIVPQARNFYDLFAGGCAVTHAANFKEAQMGKETARRSVCLCEEIK